MSIRIRGIITALLVTILLLTGCTRNKPYVETYEPYVAPTMESATPYTTPLVNEPPQDLTWISPSEVTIGYFEPSARAEWDITIHNGSNDVATYLIAYKYPSRVREGYEFPEQQVSAWVTVSDANPVLMPRETRNIMVAVEMPKDATVSSDKWEFWVSVCDTGQDGNIITELCSRWLVQMKEETNV